ncbi:MAG: hypothetical protein ABJP76_12085, partial [Flavobacteriaceae bacterium]
SKSSTSIVAVLVKVVCISLPLTDVVKEKFPVLKSVQFRSGGAVQANKKSNITMDKACFIIAAK